ncbi:MAG: hypothetical protein KAX31_00260 [Thermoplasmata archaeon]|nr:hypothetical protein [Thermoplasmata archaeon]
MDSELDTEEQGLAVFDAKKLPKDIKREAREEWHYMLYLRGKLYREIEVITGYERTTIWKDIKRVIGRLGATPRDMESIRQMAMMSLRITRSEVLDSARKAQIAAGGRAVPWGSVSKLYAVAAGIDETILERYTQRATPQGSPADIEKAKIIIDFMVSKFGAESLDDFEEYYTRHLNLKRAIPVEVEAAPEES